MIAKVTPLFSEVLNEMPSVLRLNKALDLRAMARTEPTRAVEELMDTVRSLKKEGEMVGALEKVGIGWRGSKRRKIE